MRWGCCTSVDNLPLLEATGYDYVELNMGGLADDTQYKLIDQALSRSGLAAEAFNVLLPGELKVVGSEVDQSLIAEYIGTVFPRARALGGKIVVFGSGRSRRVPDGFPRERAHQQVRDFLRFVGDMANGYDLMIAVEPLRHAECNLVNYVEEAYLLARQVDLESVGVLADFYHMSEGSDPLEHIIDAREALVHFHLADTGRMWPGSGSYDYQSFFATVKAADYDQRMSLECNFHHFARDIEEALAFLQEQWRKAQA